MSDSWKGKASASGQVSDSVEGKYDDYVPELIDNTQVQQAELKDMAIGDPSLLAPSNKNAALPPAATVTEPDSQLSETAAENVEAGKRKIDGKGKGKEVEPSESAAENVEAGKRKIDEKGKGKEVEPSESAAENVEKGKRKIDEMGKGKEVEEKEEDGGGEEEEEEVKEEAAVRKPKQKQRKRRKQKKRSVRELLQITEPIEIPPEDEDY